jgi:hypothetical protein
MVEIGRCVFHFICSFGDQIDISFLCVEKYLYFLNAYGQPSCIPRRYAVYVNYFTDFLSTMVMRFMSILICSACLNKVFLKFVKDC